MKLANKYSNSMSDLGCRISVGAKPKFEIKDPSVLKPN